MAFMPCMGLLALWATGGLMRPRYVWKYDLVLLTVMTAIPPVTLFLSVLDRTDRPFCLRAQWLFILLSASLFGYLCNQVAAGAPRLPGMRSCALLACALGFLAPVPLTQLWEAARKQPKAAAIAATAILCVHIYWVYLGAIWNLLAPLTGALVRSVLLLSGTPTSLAIYHLSGPHLQVYSSNFGIDIWYPCSGLEGVSLVVYLLSLLYLFDWTVFSRFRHLWDAYLVAIPLMLAVNILRISAFFLYGSYMHRHNAGLARTVTTEAFHSNVGLVFYLLAIAAAMPFLYRTVREGQES
jgi:exosortase/archaeosortase family protein